MLEQYHKHSIEPSKTIHASLMGHASQDDDDIGPRTPGRLVGRAPPLSNQAVFFLTGALAGASTAPIESLWLRIVHGAPGSLQLFALNPVYRSSIRFWAFDIARYYAESLSIPSAIKGGLSGAAGGLAEICIQSLFRNKLPQKASLMNQSAKLFLCFGTYTWLSSTLSPEQLPPKPFWYCWLMGSFAGGLGSGIVARAGGITGPALWRAAVPKGALTIGTVIAVQVTTCAVFLPRNRIESNHQKTLNGTR